MKRIYLDIETLPAAGDKVALIKDLYQEYKKRDTQKLAKKNFDQYFRETSFQGEFGRIFCIGYAIDNQPVNCLHGNEKKILEDFWHLARDVDLFIGHNIIEFDLRFIYKRSIILGVKPSKDLSFARYRNSPIFDTLKEWDKWSNNSISLHMLSVILGIDSPKEDGIDGSQVYDNFLAGNSDKIIEYCKRDVEATRKVYKKMNFIIDK